MIQKLLALLVMLTIGISVASAQDIHVTGVVKGGDSEPLPGVSVVLKGTSTGTITDISGKYSLHVPQHGTLVFSFVGMSPQEIAINERKNIDVVLKDESINMDEVVVVAYGVTKKSTFTGSATTVKSDVIEKRQTSSISQSLQGVAPGVQVTMNSGQPGQDAQIRIRGISSLNSSSEPLWVIDGIPYEGNLNAINSDDIESMTILKDAASAALYGARGANGVIMVTTKKGKKGQKPTINLKAVVGTSGRAVKEYKKLHTVDWMEMQWEAMRNGSIGSDLGGLSPAQWATDNLIKNIVYNPIYKDGKAVANPIGTDGKVVPGSTAMWDENWYDAVTQTPIRQEYQLSISGGTEKLRYAGSLGYLNDEGITRESYFKRYNGRLSLEADINKWFSTGLAVQFAYSDQNYPPQENENIGFPYVFSRLVAPIYPVYKRNTDGSVMTDNNGNPIFDLGDDNPKRPIASGQNPRASLGLNTKKYGKTSLDPSWWFQINILPGLSFKNNIAINTWHGDDDQIYSRIYADAKGLGYQYKYRNSQMVINANQILSYNHTFKNEHNLGLMLGHESSSNEKKFLTSQKSGTYSDDYDEFAMSTTMVNLTSHTEKLTREGYFGRVNYDYQSKYFVEASYRRDASSRFYIDNCWGNFWSVSGGWTLTREKFMENIKWLNLLKLRLSYGVQGNDNMSDWYAWQGLASTSNNALNYNGNMGVFYTKMENKDLTWEKNKSWNVGMDFAVLNQRLSGSVEFYNRMTSDMLFSLPMPLSNGFAERYENVGSMVNRGVDIDLNAIFHNGKNIQVGASFNMSYLYNQIKSLPQESIISGNKQWQVGHGAYEFYMYEYAGVDSETGDALYYGEGQDGRIKTADISKASKYYVGNALAPVQFTLAPYINLYGIDFSFSLSGVFGNQIYDNAYQRMMHTGGSYGTQWSADILNRWTTDNRYTDVPKVTIGSNSYTVDSSRFLFKGDYLRLRTLTLGYTLPKTWLTKAGINTARVYIQGDNLLTFKLGDLPDGSDPEVLDGTQSTNSTTAKTISFGVNVNF